MFKRTISVVGWNRGLLTVSLMQLVMSTGRSLTDAKRLVEGLVSGEPFDVEFDDEVKAACFAEKATEYGARVSMR